jgi:CTP synthase
MKAPNNRKYIFVTGGVLSGVGKGITAASIGNILKARGLRIGIQKCDPYLNVDAGTLNPAEHGEVFVTKDGAETDLDLGHYERFLDEEMTQASSLMSGRILLKIIEDERAGKYAGEDVQMVPHLTGLIQDYILEASQAFDVYIVEIGGTVGDIEGQAWVEAIREFGLKQGLDNCFYVHVVYLPYLGASKELKTKPAQNAVKDLRNAGIVPDMLVARSENPAPIEVKQKLSLFGGVPPEAIVLLPNAASIYQVPLELEAQKVGAYITTQLDLLVRKPNFSAWEKINDAIAAPKQKAISIGIIAKYLDNEDTYFSVVESLRIAGWHEGVEVNIKWVDAETISSKLASLKKLDGVIVPGGFGTRGVEGKIAAAGYALDNKIPYLGICLGLQAAVIATARRGGLAEATSEELEPKAAQNTVYLMPSQTGLELTGGTMRLGSYPANLKKGSLTARLYGTSQVSERHRHRYEVNRVFEKEIISGGLSISGESPDGRLVEFIEASSHPYFVATQAHPEFKSRPHRPHPLFKGLIQAARISKR